MPDQHHVFLVLFRQRYQPVPYLAQEESAEDVQPARQYLVQESEHVVQFADQCVAQNSENELRTYNIFQRENRFYNVHTF